MKKIKIANKEKLIKNSGCIIASLCLASTMMLSIQKINKTVDDPMKITMPKTIMNKCECIPILKAKFTSNDEYISKHTEKSLNEIVMINKIIKDKCNKYDVDEKFVQAICMVESNYNIKCVGPKTKYGYALGLMQLMPELIKDYGVTDPYDVEQNVDAGVKFIKFLFNRYENKKYYDQNGKLIPTNDIVAIAFNWGFGNLEKHNKTNECVVIAKTKYGIPVETYNYIQKLHKINLN